MPSDLCKRIIPCLDVDNGMTVKGVKFGNLRAIGNPVDLAIAYEEQGADELTFLDISASRDERATLIQLVRDVAHHLSIPFTVGGGVGSLDAVKQLLASGADKITVNTAAVHRPGLINEIAAHCGSQCCVVAIDARRKRNGGQTGGDSGLQTEVLSDSQVRWEVLVKGGGVDSGRDAFEWAKECVERGAGEILLTSWDRDGTLEGFDLELVRLFASSFPIPIIASGGAKDAGSFIDVFTDGKADAALAASIFHDGQWTIKAVKEQLKAAGVPVRIC